MTIAELVAQKKNAPEKNLEGKNIQNSRIASESLPLCRLPLRAQRLLKSRSEQPPSLRVRNHEKALLAVTGASKDFPSSQKRRKPISLPNPLPGRKEASKIPAQLRQLAGIIKDLKHEKDISLLNLTREHIRCHHFLFFPKNAMLFS